jgi:hypothetical protein
MIIPFIKPEERPTLNLSQVRPKPKMKPKKLRKHEDEILDEAITTTTAVVLRLSERIKFIAESLSKL